MNCPNCGLINPEGAAWCDCGYIFASGQINPELKPPDPRTGWFDRPRSAMWKIGTSVLAVLVALGILAFGIGVSLILGFLLRGGRIHKAVEPGRAVDSRWFEAPPILLGGLLVVAIWFIVGLPAKRRHR